MKLILREFDSEGNSTRQAVPATLEDIRYAAKGLGFALIPLNPSQDKLAQVERSSYGLLTGWSPVVYKSVL